MRPAEIGATTLQDLTLGYDPSGNINSIADAVTANLSQTFQYDLVGRVTQGVGPYGTENYTYDALGNRLTRSVVNGGTTNTTYTYTAANTRLASAATGSQTLNYSYDATGSRITTKLGNQTQASYTYNADARLATSGTNAFKYNGFGERSVATVTGGGTHFIFADDGKLLSEHTVGGALVRNYIYLNGVPFALVDAAGTVSYMLNDQLGQPQKMLNTAGAASWHRVAGIFGSTVSQPAGTTASNPLRFPGQQFDPNLALHYNYFRTYDPATGRYLEADPIGLEGGPNLYTYVDGNPVSYSDPTGEFANLVIGGAIGGLTGYLTGDECYGARDFIRDAALGAATGGLGGKGLQAGLKGLSNGTKGKIGEGLSHLKNTALGSQRVAKNKATIPGQTTIVDHTYRSITGKIYYVESKFGKSNLSTAQRRAQREVGDAYRVERWSYEDFNKAGATAGGGAGGAASGVAGRDPCGC